MNIKIVAQLTVAASLLAVLWTSLGSQAAHAQERTQRYVSISLESADVRDALKQLFNQADVSYSIAPEVRGSVTARLSHIPFPDALFDLCKQADLNYSVRGGVYEVEPLNGPSKVYAPVEAALPTQGADGGGMYGVALTQDSKYIYVVKGYEIWKLVKADLKVVSHANLLHPSRG